MSSSCTHVSALLHALVALTQTEFQLHPDLCDSSNDDENKPLPVTSYACQWKHGHSNLVVRPSGLLVSKAHPFLGASPDGLVYDPSDQQQPHGFLEVKCPYSQRDLPPAC